VCKKNCSRYFRIKSEKTSLLIDFFFLKRNFSVSSIL
jgi:hypothetical protein